MDRRRAILLAVKERRLTPAEAKEALRSLSAEPTPVLQTPAAPRAVAQAERQHEPYIEPIAIIGIAGRFPEAGDIDEFWNNLAAGRCSVKKVPSDRGWNVSDYYDPRPQTPGRTYATQGAYLSDVAAFDAKFFGISPREAERMDPSERLFLQESWRAIENAGYSPTAIAGQRWGVFACAKGDYAERIQQQDPTFHFSTDSIAASRLSYLLDLVGPAVTVDTACSSTLAAIAYACDSLALGNCDVAIAGGGGIYTTASMLVTASQASLFSPTGHTYTFDSRADGIVLGEVIGSVVLKPLARAIEAGDPIWGVIRGWGTNQDGRTNGITAPNANAQARLQSDVYRRFGIDPAGITLVEAHGTGTRLGDPIEVQALTDSFRDFTQRSHYCALSSVKPNIGHAFFGAGVAAVIKVLLCMRHKQIPPSINFEKLNPHIRLEGTPFFMGTQLAPWTVHAGETRRAAVSSFGATGINVHLVIEEFSGSEASRRSGLAADRECLVPFSARTPDQLREYVRYFAGFLRSSKDQNPPYAQLSLENIAYTLQVARPQQAARLALVVSSLDRLDDALGRYLHGQAEGDGIFCGEQKATGSGIRAAFSAAGDAIHGLTADEPAWRDIASAWVRGANAEWPRLYETKLQTAPHRIHLPGYSFAKDKHWIEGGGASPQPHDIHPLLQRNVSSAGRRVFSSRFTGEEFFLAHHRVQGNRVLPGVAYLEMVRAAMSASLEGAAGGSAIAISRVVWVQPYIFTSAANELHIELSPISPPTVHGAMFEFQIYAEEGGRTVHCTGVVGLARPEQRASLDLVRIRQDVHETNLLARDCYARFASLGFELGPKMQGLREIYRGANQVLARLALPEAIQASADPRESAFTLHPALMDSALQACIGFSIGEQVGYSFAMDKPALPFVLEHMEVSGQGAPCTWVWIRAREQNEEADRVQRFDLDLCDDSGKLCVRMRGFCSSELKRALGSASAAPESAATQDVVVESKLASAPIANVTGLLLLEPVWVAGPRGANREWADAVTHHVLLCDVSESVASRMNLTGANVSIVRSSEAAPGSRFVELATGAFDWVKQILLERASDGPLTLQVIAPIEAEVTFLRGLAGVLTRIPLENERALGRLILVDGRSHPDVLAEGDLACSDLVVRYVDDIRECVRWQEFPAAAAAAAPWKDRGVYLFTGGVGGLAKQLATQITRDARDVRIVLSGPAPLDRGQEAALLEMDKLAAAIEYTTLDSSDPEATRRAVEDIVSKHGALNGIIQCPSLFERAPFAAETAGEFSRALAGIVLGATHLDAACEGIALDFFMLCSSSAAALGSAAQQGEIAGQLFVADFAGDRNERVRQGRCSGRTMSIAWPPLADEDARYSEHLALLRHNTGMVPLDAASAAQALRAAWASSSSEVLLISGDLDHIRATMGTTWLASRELRQPGAITGRAADRENLQENIQHALIEAISEVNKLAVADVDVDADLGDLGFDSISLTSLGDVLNRRYALTLLPTSFFEHPTVAKFATYLLREHAQAFRNAWNLHDDAPSENRFIRADADSQSTETTSVREERHYTASPSHANEPIAIVGISGRFPMARDVAELWDNLAAGRDCISEIPPSRWDWRAIHGNPRTEPDKTNIRWGGFIEGVDEFDPLFFNIPPRDAELLDPQHRLLMSHVWSVIEDAGHAPGSLAGTNTAIFIGTAGDMGYGDLVTRATGRDYAPPPVSMAPNRMSYFLDLRGPSEPIETACSSSLVAIHRAVAAIRAGLCDMAIAGGVQTIVTPAKHISFSKSGLLCEDGRCKAFSARANGFVRGEGVGMVMLKRLSDAEAAGDHIYAVILGTAENHGGRASSFTAPNPAAQAELLKAAYRQSGVDITSVSYIEAHGTGTELGDPIEINGLKAAFADLMRDSRGAPQSSFCGLGSVKSNIGHLEIAAGVAGVIKVILQMQHRTLAKSLHCEQINPYIQLDGSPFYIVQEQQPWSTGQDGSGRPLPRRAGVSSFGIGGSNAHIVLEEYISARGAERSRGVPVQSEPMLILLSARTAERLHDAARHLLAFVQRDDAKNHSIRDIAYTLQVGRDAMEERLGFMAATLQELEARLRMFLACEPGADLPAQLRRGQARRHKEVLRGLEGDEELGEMVEKWLDRRKFSKLLDLWVNGLSIDWARLYRGARPSRLSLPTYPFERERYWVQAEPQYTVAAVDVKLHPLLHRNTSGLSQQRFTSELSGREFFFADHVVQDVKVLPGVAYLEMARAAVEQSIGNSVSGDQVFCLRNVAWIRPVALTGERQTVHISLIESAEDGIQFEIFTDSAGAETATHCMGIAEIAQREPAPHVAVAELLAGKTRHISGEDLYEHYRAIGIAYGPGHRGVVQIHAGVEEAVGELSLPESVRAHSAQYYLHPALMDSALQVSLALSQESSWMNAAPGAMSRPILPFALERLELHSCCTERMWARVRLRSDASVTLLKVDVDLYDDAGRLCVRMIGLTSRVLSHDLKPPEDLLIATPQWQESARRPVLREELTAKRWVVLFERDEHVAHDIERLLPGCVCTTILSNRQSQDRFTELATSAFSALQTQLRNDTLLVQWVAPENFESGALAALAGLLRTMSLENPRLAGQLILTTEGDDAAALCERLVTDGHRSQERLIRHANGVRQVLAWEERNLGEREIAVPWKSAGTYLITGGMGGLGQVLAREILAQIDNANVILIGRKSEDEVADALHGLRAALGSGTLDYRQVDVCSEGQVERLIAEVIARHGSLQGILHCAGVLRDSFLIKKTAAQFTEALAPKVTGTLCLDRATRALDLDFLVLFSSAAAVLGNFGQADYAVANAFQDEFARIRNAQVAERQRAGHTLSVNWPLWREGGMSISAHAQEQARAQFGLMPLSTRNALRVLYCGLQSGVTQLLVLSGERIKLRTLIGLHGEDEPGVELSMEPRMERRAELSEAALATPGGEDDLAERASAFFVTLVSSTLKIPSQRIRASDAMEQYGIDSIVVMDLTQRLETHFGSLSKTLFFEYQTLGELARYFLRAYPEKMRELLSSGRPQTPMRAASSHATSGLSAPRRLSQSRSKRPAKLGGFDTGIDTSAASEHAESRTPGALDIAIVGLSGRYPLARDLDEYWENLRAGRDCIGEVPRSRWDWRKHYDPEHQRPGAHYSKWGGFIEGVDEFDPLFFNISPREAEYMDPQERLFLMHAWQALEDAGYTRASLQAGSGVDGLTPGARVGVYAGLMYVEYQLFGAEQTLLGNPLSLSGSAASVSNRVSYILGLQGPSLTVDTMCSSSLTAIHLACQDLKAGRTSVAIAGGANLSLHGNKYLLLSSGQFISTNGKCESFGAGGDGYIPGEGVGVIVLKRLADAVRARDHIYGVIKGSAINHGGKTYGYSVPNPVAQQLAIADALREAQIDPRTVSYVEAHGTGTKLGDPVEITGLMNGFTSQARSDLRSAGQYCWIGSAKSNIGHCESAAGIAGLTKVLLQFRHGQIAPSLHAQVLNPHIDFTATPFQVNRELRAWERPMLTDERGVSRTYPRIAGVSSFGAGGSNAHLVVEEYLVPAASGAADSDEPQLLLLSARSKEQIAEYARRLSTFLETSSVALRDLCYTLQVGREARSERLALVVHSMAELRDKLALFLSEPRAVDGLYVGTVSDAGVALGALSNDAEMRKTVRAWIERGKLAQLAELWVHGSTLDWTALHQGATPARVSLPTYPFARERYWIPNERIVAPTHAHSRLHPLLHRNTSELLKQRFSSTFSGNEPFLADHIVRGDRVLPGVVYFEMARAGLQKALGLEPAEAVPMVLEDLSWAQPLIVSGEREVHLELQPRSLEGGSDSAVEFEIYTFSEPAQRVIHARGRATLSEAASSDSLDLQTLRAAMTEGHVTAAECYERFESAGLRYGASHRGLVKLYLGRDELLAEIHLPASAVTDSHGYVTHPSLLDSALQAGIGLAVGSGDQPAYLPYSVERVEIHRACELQMWAWLRRTLDTSSLQKIDIDLCDAQGTLCVRVLGLASRPLAQIGGSVPISGTVLAAPKWLDVPLSSTHARHDDALEHHIVMCDLPEGITQHLQRHLEGSSRCLVLDCDQPSWAARYANYSAQLFEHIKGITKKALVQLVLPDSAYGRILHGLSGLLRCAELETARITAQTIGIGANIDPADAAALLSANAMSPQDKQIRHIGGKRSVLCWEELASPTLTQFVPWREGSVYLITGGLGGLGQIFAREIIARTSHATIVLTGRSPCSVDALQRLQLESVARGHKVLYLQADITDAEQTSQLLNTIVAEHGAPRGVLHSAGVSSSGFMVNRTTEQFRHVLAAKVAGTENLDQATRHLDLDFFVLFSSSTAVTGAIGQADYACANGFMDGFASHRNELVSAGQRSGSSLSINWPLWEQGGMRVDAQAMEAMEQLLGWHPMRTPAGIQAFYSALASKRAQVLVQAGSTARIRAALGSQQPLAPSPRRPLLETEQATVGTNVDHSHASSALLEEFAVEFVTSVLSRTLRLAASRIDRRTNLEQYGLESKLVLDMTHELEKKFGPLPKTLFFEQRSVAELGRYLIEHHHERLSLLYRPNADQPAQRAAASKPKQLTVARTERIASRPAPAPVASIHDDAIAIIGLSGRYPQSENIEAFWRNLREARDSIEEIPAGRWDWRAYSRAAAEQGLPAGRWGGFIDGVDQFDPLFFNISPHEARYLDPQERLFLEHAWIALEDAAYTRQSLESHRVGVYAGVMYSEYQLFGAEQTARGNPMGFASSLASIANRVSFVLNLHGPSMVVDTMCSSSLTAIHAACQDLRLGHTSMAIAGGVNVSVHPNKYLALSSGRFLSSQGRCTSFGANGDGYVPGEGVGVVILKRLADARRDHDPIYGVIRGSAVNHGGKTNGYSVPSPTAQQDVIGTALRRSGIDPRAVSYIETHGTGTRLGDPIEIAGLSRAFGQLATDDSIAARTECCWIGSVKSNIGHCESAAGIAGLTKVLLQIQHGEIVPSLHSSVLNPYIDFAATPFQVNQTLRPWPRPALTGPDGSTRTYPRIAGVSSFGAGGSNAHLLIEEYVPDAPVDARQPAGPCIAPLSARTPEQLASVASRLLAFLESAEARGNSVDLRDLCFTLQVGREAMVERLALTAHTLAELRERLATHLTNPDEVVVGVYRGRSGAARSLLDSQDEGIQNAVATWMASGNYSKLLDFWVHGLAVDWNRLYGGSSPRPQRIRLPTYPFAKERYWVDEAPQARPLGMAVAHERLHPLVHRNISDFFAQRYSSTFTGEEPFLADHVVRLEEGRTAPVLPASAYLEMARGAMQNALAVPEQHAHNMARLRLRDVAWLRPFTVSARPETLHLLLSCDAEGRVSYRFHAAGDESVLYATGTGELAEFEDRPPRDLTALKRAVGAPSIPVEQCYERLRQVGLEYGPAHRAIAELFRGGGQVLARLELPAQASRDRDLIVHPSILDAAIQASIGLTWNAEDCLDQTSSEASGAIPFALDELRLFAPCTENMWAWVRQAPAARLTKIDIDLLDESGVVCIELRGLTSRTAQQSTADAGQDVRITAPRWVELQQARIGAALDDNATADRRWIVLCEQPDLDPYDLQSKVDGAVCLPLQSAEAALDRRFACYAAELMELLQYLFSLRNEDGTLRERCELQLVVPGSADGDAHIALLALLRSARLENARFRGQLVQVDSLHFEDVAAALNVSWRQQSDLIRWQHGQPLARTWMPIAVDARAVPPPWKHGGVYLITGGLGGLGRLFSEAILRTTQGVTLILCGRSEPDAARQQQLADLNADLNTGERGRAVLYKQVDVTDASAVTTLISGIEKEFGTLNGILHSVGTRSNSLLMKKTEHQLRSVLAPKIAGAINLSEASRHQALDFFVLFSSAAAVWGGIGQADYAAANAFLDEWAKLRDRRVASGECSGRTLSINWPYWKEGGMRMEAQYQAQMRDAAGLAALDTEVGLQSFYLALMSGEAQVLVEAGEVERIDRYRAGLEAAAPRVETRAAAPLPPGAQVQQDPGGTASEIIKSLLAAILKVPAENIRDDEPLETYGMNSVMAIDITQRLEAIFGTLSKTLLYEYQTIRELSRHFVRYHAETLRQERSPKPDDSHRLPVRVARTAPVLTSPAIEPRPGPLDVAIIGLSGRFPRARNVQEFWELLRTGTDCISEVPPERWAAAAGAQRRGGFISGVEEFDPLFFRISPRDADHMDPQERLFLEHAWAALEDAGYTRAALQERAGGRVGVYAGVMYSEYHLLALESGTAEQPVAASASYASIANRVSYALNLAGPSMTVDTMCSSSLTCVHLACQDLKLGRTRLAIAGGVNVSIHPNKFSVLGASGFLSSRGRCESFGAGGDGYVPSEGVGVVILKRLEDAVRDGDGIYGVIKGSALNHGGKTNGYTVPNPNAQQSVVEEAIQESGVHPGAITYVEAHGTGTKLGDPIEITGLSKAFAASGMRAAGAPILDDRNMAPICWLGSVKSNIGHCESAAGIAALIKVLLQMKHGQIAPSLHSQALNGNIDFSATPFQVNQTLRRWQRPYHSSERGRTELPRIAGISSFGAGGSNAHLIVEEYAVAAGARHAIAGPFLIPISAQDDERLREYAQRLREHLDNARPELADVAFTLQTGREPMPARLGILAGALDELSAKLGTFAAGEAREQGVFQGRAQRGPVLEDVAVMIAGRQHESVLNAWVSGMDVNWEQLYAAGNRPCRIHLPTYPFARHRHWLPGAKRRAQSVDEIVTQPANGRRVVLIPSWVEHGRRKSETVSGTVVVAHTAGTIALARALFCASTSIEVLLVAHDPGASGGTDFYCAESGLLAAEAIVREASRRKVIGLIDLTGCDDVYERSVDLEAGKIRLLQVLVEQLRGLGLRLLQVTHQRVRFKVNQPTLSGARTSGLYRMLGAEYGTVRSATMDSDLEVERVAELAAQVESEFLIDARERYFDSCYRDARRYESRLVESAAQNAALSLTANDVVLVTGGTRGIGRSLVEHLVARGARRLAILGREQLPDLQSEVRSEKADFLRHLIRSGAQVMYFNPSLLDGPALQRMVASVRSTFGPITNVFHCAGVSGQSPAFYRKPVAQWAQVCEPKVQGLIALHEALRDQPLERFVLFSSVASAMPDVASGQSDYAAANGFMDSFAARHAEYMKSIQWPAWAEVGMAAGFAPSAAYQKARLLPLKTRDALALLDSVLAAPHAVSLPAIMVENATQDAPHAQPAGQPIEAALRWLRALFATELRLKPEQVDDDKTFEEYGVESIVVAQLVRTMSAKVAAALDPSVLFEHRSIRAAALYLSRNYATAFAEGDIPLLNAVPAVVSSRAEQATRTAVGESAGVAPSRPDDIAVVGIACRFPQAAHHEDFWKLLEAGVSAISRGPDRRWGSSQQYPGGWIDDIECFDPKFFNIQPDDARVMDPQMRLLLEESVAAISDAGYDYPQLAGKRIGVYIGARSQSMASVEAIASTTNPVMGLAPNYIATSISRCFDFHGPSTVVDTACSSALSGLSFAADALAAGRIEMALVGAVNLLQSPGAHEMFKARGILSPSGEVRIFDRRADGDVLGEGGGIVIVKRFGDAVRDGNRIYAVVKSIALNNDGRTLGPGSPNIHAQREVLKEAIERSGRSVEEVGYIEVSGSGSPIVDAVELRALTDCYRLNEPALGPCHLGSVKPNIGHLLLGSGLAAFLRCVLSVHHKTIAPFLSAIEPFEHYDFANSRVVFDRASTPWALRGMPVRVAALSSFADGGTNAHVIIEEFVPPVGYEQRLHARPVPAMDRRPMSAAASDDVDAEHEQIEQQLFEPALGWGDDELAGILRRFKLPGASSLSAGQTDHFW